MKSKKKAVKSKPSPKAKAKGKKKPKPKVMAVRKEVYFRVDTEVPTVQKGVTNYTYTTGAVVPEEQARNTMEGMKLMGMGGRLVHMDGTPDGKIHATWGNVDRMAAAERVEKAALESNQPTRQN